MSNNSNNIVAPDGGRKKVANEVLVTNGNSSLSTRAISGSIGSIITSLAVTPLEVAKVRTQQQQQQHVGSSSTTLCGCGRRVVLFNGHLDCVVSRKAFPVETVSATHNGGIVSVLRRIFAKEGFRGIYAGLQPTLVMAVPNTVLYFSAYEEMIWRLRQRESNNNNNKTVWTYPLVAGASARFVASSVTSPFEFLRTRQATEGQVSAGLLNDFRTIVRTEGFTALYSGLRPTLWRDVPFSAIYWYCLEDFRLYWRRNYPNPTPLEQASQAFLNGACAGMIAAACTTPFDVVKTHQQTMGKPEIATPPPPPQYLELSLCKHAADGAVVPPESSKISTTQQIPSGTFSMMREIVEREGWSGLWRGNVARMLKVAPSCAIMLSSYELGKRLLE